jgi:ribose-phosphate pyrophosphokinase
MESIIFDLENRNKKDGFVDSILNYLRTNEFANLQFGEMKSPHYSDKEFSVDFTSSVRGKRVFLLTTPNDSEKLHRLYFSIDACVRANAEKIIVVMPYMPFSRQDKKDDKRGPIGSKVILKIIENLGATDMILFDLHAQQLEGFVDIPITHIEGKNLFGDYIAKLIKHDNINTILATPDAGGSKRVKQMRDYLSKYHDINLSYVTVDKERSGPNQIDKMTLIGDVKDKRVIIIDDIIDTGGTIGLASDLMMEMGASSVIVIGSHAVFSGDVFNKLNKKSISEIIVSDSIYTHSTDANYLFSKNTTVFSLYKLIGLAILAEMNGLSYDEIKNKRYSTNKI